MSFNQKNFPVTTSICTVTGDVAGSQTLLTTDSLNFSAVGGAGATVTRAGNNLDISFGSSPLLFTELPLGTTSQIIFDGQVTNTSPQGLLFPINDYTGVVFNNPGPAQDMRFDFNINLNSTVVGTQAQFDVAGNLFGDLFETLWTVVLDFDGTFYDLRNNNLSFVPALQTYVDANPLRQYQSEKDLCLNTVLGNVAPGNHTINMFLRCEYSGLSFYDAASPMNQRVFTVYETSALITHRP
jgi:hypothetical protein